MERYTRCTENMLSPSMAATHVPSSKACASMWCVRMPFHSAAPFSDSHRPDGSCTFGHGPHRLLACSSKAVITLSQRLDMSCKFVSIQAIVLPMMLDAAGPATSRLAQLPAAPGARHSAAVTVSRREDQPQIHTLVPCGVS